jgi:transcriptional regulator with XRE-family HTH domain
MDYAVYATFRAKLEALGWSQAEFSRRVGASAVTVRRWKQLGKAPMWAVRYLEQAQELRELRALRERVSALKDSL